MIRSEVDSESAQSISSECYRPPHLRTCYGHSLPLSFICIGVPDTKHKSPSAYIRPPNTQWCLHDLPVLGFPMHTVPLDTSTCDDIQRRLYDLVLGFPMLTKFLELFTTRLPQSCNAVNPPNAQVAFNCAPKRIYPTLPFADLMGSITNFHNYKNLENGTRGQVQIGDSKTIMWLEFTTPPLALSSRICKTIAQRTNCNQSRVRLK